MKPEQHFEYLAQKSKHSLRRNGTETAWFLTREEAEHFAVSPANPAYMGDLAHLSHRCDFYHLSQPSWLEPVLSASDYQLPEAAGIQTPLLCTLCGSPQCDGVDFFILPSGALRCTALLSLSQILTHSPDKE
jgi:hypothetical protein